MRRIAILGGLVAALLMIAFALPGRASADEPTPVICIVFIPIGEDAFLVQFVEGKQITNPSGGTLTVCRGEIPAGAEPETTTMIDVGACTLTLTPGGTLTYICRT